MDNIKTIDCLKKSRHILLSIFIYQFILLIITFYLLIYYNFLAPYDQTHLPILNSALFSLIGALIYFSRKSYVYLITSKFYKISKKENYNNQNLNSIFLGYYLYLIFRPFVGLIIGPILYMLSTLGLITFVKTQINIDPEFSKKGEYFIYLLSFFAGHACSDMFDYFSKVAKKIIIKNNEKVTSEKNV